MPHALNVSWQRPSCALMREHSKLSFVCACKIGCPDASAHRIATQLALCSSWVPGRCRTSSLLRIDKPRMQNIIRYSHSNSAYARKMPTSEHVSDSAAGSNLEQALSTGCCCCCCCCCLSFTDSVGFLSADSAAQAAAASLAACHIPSLSTPTAQG